MYCVNGNSSWYSDCGPLFGGCPLLGVSVIGGSTVVATIGEQPSGLYRGVATSQGFFIGERERANLVVRSSGIFYIYIYLSFVRRVSAHARLLTRFFLSEIISKFFTFSHTLPRDMI